MAASRTRENVAGREPGRGLAIRALDLLSSVWFGIGVLALLFVYMSVGSAGYVIRQTRLFEMTEFEWFHWWPFDLLVALLCVSMALVTVRRIRLSVVNAGVWMIHIGVITLCVGSVIYFSAKVEGDTPVFRRRVVIESPAHEPVSLVALPGAHAVVGEGDERRVYEVVETRPDWPILTGADEGKKAYSVSVAVTGPVPAGAGAEGAPAASAATGAFTRQLLDGFPAYTEDIIPGKGRAIKTIGAKLVDESLSMRLETEPQEWFYLVNTWALYSREVRPDGSAGEWSHRPIRGLPRYNDYIASREDVWPTLDEAPLKIDPIDIRLPAGAGGAPEAHVTGYLRYAAKQARYVQGDAGARVNPVAQARLGAPGSGATRAAGSRAYTLAAFDPNRSASDDGALAFVWAQSAEDLARVGASAEGEIVVTLPMAGGVETRVPAAAPNRAAGEPDPDFTPVGPEGAGYAIRVREIVDNLALGDGRTLSLAITEIRTPSGEFTRWVAEDPAATRDFVDNASGSHDLRAPDTSIVTTYSPARRSAPVTLVAGPGAGDAPDALKLVVSIPGMERRESVVRIGEPVALGPQAEVVVESYWPRAAEASKPVIVPTSQRDRDAGVNYAMIKVEVDAGGRTESRWLSFHQYVFDDASYVYGGRFRFEPERMRLADGRVIEVIFSRERRPLPSPVRLEDFRLVAHVGGFTGEVASIRDWESVIRFDNPRAPTGRSEARFVRTNTPVESQGFRYFQAMWDPPMPQAGSGGLNFTGLGIGNRRGVGIQLGGSILATIGMLYAFYFKPVIKRRRAEAALARAGAPARGFTPGLSAVASRSAPEADPVGAGRAGGDA